MDAETNLASPSDFIEDDDTKTKSNISAFINGTPGLENLTIVTGTTGDRIIIQDEKGKEVTRVELDDKDDDKVISFIEELISIATNRATLEQKGLTTQGKRKTTQSKRQGRGRLTGGTTPSAPRPSGGAAPRPGG
jgi:hypothetical protein